MTNISKSQKHHLRELSATAYERELTHSLGELKTHFAAWDAGTIDALHLNQLVHEYHNGTARELYSAYTISEPIVAVARALSRKFLKWDEVQEDCKPLFIGWVKDADDVTENANKA